MRFFLPVFYPKPEKCCLLAIYIIFAAFFQFDILNGRMCVGGY
jgi:hypothetical protein